MSTSNLVLIWKVRMWREGRKGFTLDRSGILRGSMGLIVMMRPAPTLQLAFQMRTGVGHLRWTLTDWVILEKIKRAIMNHYTSMPIYDVFTHTKKRRSVTLFLTHVDRERMIFSTQSRSSWRARLKQMQES